MARFLRFGQARDSVAGKFSFRIAYAAFNDAALMVEVSRYLRTIGVDADVFFDRRSDPAEAEMLKANGVRFEYIDNEHGFVEGVYGKIAARTPEDWVFILTSDEIPTRATLSATERLIQAAPAHINSIAFPRRWVMRTDDGRFVESRAAFIGEDPQWRIIRHRDVEFRAVVHSPGYDLDKARAEQLGPEAAVYHLDWVVHSRALRERKLHYYDRIMPGAAAGFRKWYVPEECIEDHGMVPLADAAVLEFARRVAAIRTDQAWVDKVGAKKASG